MFNYACFADDGGINVFSAFKGQMKESLKILALNETKSLSLCNLCSFSDGYPYCDYLKIVRKLLRDKGIE